MGQLLQDNVHSEVCGTGVDTNQGGSGRNCQNGEDTIVFIISVKEPQPMVKMAPN